MKEQRDTYKALESVNSRKWEETPEPSRFWSTVLNSVCIGIVVAAVLLWALT